jgi:hypothetical protein
MSGNVNGAKEDDGFREGNREGVLARVECRDHQVKALAIQKMVWSGSSYIR